MGKRIDAYNARNEINSADSNSETVASFSSLKNQNNAISTKMKDANASFYKSYQSASGPTPEPNSRKNYRTYPYDYFSGIDAKVFFGDVWVDDIVTIQYSVSQNKTPIYGYASQLYDAIARGTVIVQGSLTIAFKEMGYLNMVQRIIETQRAGAAKAIETKASELEQKAKDKKLEFVPNLEGSLNRTGNSVGINKVGFSPNGTAQIIRKGETIEDILRNKKGGNVVSSGLGLFYLDDPNGTRDFEDFAEVLEDTVWGDSNGHALGKHLQFRRADEFDYNYANNKDAGGIRVPKNGYADALNIMLTFGDMNDFRAEHTITVLNDVHFTSQSTIVAPTGEPIGETYTFFARDINQDITAKTFNIPEIKFQVGQDINVSKLQDIKVLENYLSLKQSNGEIHIWSIAQFASEGGTTGGWRTSKLPVISTIFQPNKHEPIIDQLIRVVERGVNDSVYSEIVTSYSQHIVEIKITYEGDTASDTYRFVIEQQIANTHTYKVISPTRNNFAAINIMSREEMWGAISSTELAKQKEKKDQALEQTKQRTEAAKKTVANEASAKKKAEEDKLKEDQATLAATEAQTKAIIDNDPLGGKIYVTDENGNVVIKTDPMTLPLNDPRRLEAMGMKNGVKAGSEQEQFNTQSQQSNFTIIQPKQQVKESQGIAGARSHSGPGYENLAAVDVTPVVTDDPRFNGQVWVPLSPSSSVTIGAKNSIIVKDNSREFIVAHVNVPQGGAGTIYNASDLFVSDKTKGIYLTPLSSDSDSKLFTGAHAHFQTKLNGTEISKQQQRLEFQEYIRERYIDAYIQYDIK